MDGEQHKNIVIFFDDYTIRPLEEQDLEPYFALVDRNRKRLEDFFTGTVSRTKNFGETKAFLAEMVEKRKNNLYYPFLVVNNTTGDFVSFFDLKNLDWSIPKSELGFYTDKEYTGKGLTTKALKLFIDHCFVHFNFKKIYLRTHQSNKATQALAKKCGFEKEGILRMDYKTTSGELVDLIYYGLLHKG